MKRNVILLDIDDTILPSPITWLGEFNDSLDILTINCKRLARICEIWGAEIRIISSWSNRTITFEDNILRYKDREPSLLTKQYYAFERKAFFIIYQYLKDYIIGISCGNKARDIKLDIQDKTIDKVIVIEDSDFSNSCNIRNGSYYIESEGYISNKMIANIGIILGKIKPTKLQ